MNNNRYRNAFDARITIEDAMTWLHDYGYTFEQLREVAEVAVTMLENEEAEAQ